MRAQWDPALSSTSRSTGTSASSRASRRTSPATASTASPSSRSTRSVARRVARPRDRPSRSSSPRAGAASPAPPRARRGRAHRVSRIVRCRRAPAAWAVRVVFASAERRRGPRPAGPHPRRTARRRGRDAPRLPARLPAGSCRFRARPAISTSRPAPPRALRHSARAATPAPPHGPPSGSPRRAPAGDRRSRRPAARARFLAQDRLCSRRSSVPGSTPIASTSAVRACRYASSASACLPERYSASIRSTCSFSRSGSATTRRSSSPTTSRWRPAVQIELDRELERRQPQLLEPADLRGRERLAGDVVERRTAPQLERLAWRAARDHLLESLRVDGVGLDRACTRAPA